MLDQLMAQENMEMDELTQLMLSGEGTDGRRQLGLFQAPLAVDDPVHRRLRDIDVNQVTPMQALALLVELKQEADG